MITQEQKLFFIFHLNHEFKKITDRYSHIIRPICFLYNRRSIHRLVNCVINEGNYIL